MKFIFKLMKKIVVAALLIYAYDVIATPLNVTIPINIFTIIIVTILGIPSMFALILFSLIFI